MRHSQRVRADRAGAEDDDLSRWHVVQARKQYAAAAVWPLQAPCADLYREASGDRRHRRKDRIAAARLSDRVINDERRAARERRLEEVRLGGELMEGANDLAAPRLAVFSLLQLFHLHHQLAVPRIAKARACGQVLSVGETYCGAAAGLDDHVL